MWRGEGWDVCDCTQHWELCHHHWFGEWCGVPVPGCWLWQSSWGSPLYWREIHAQCRIHDLCHLCKKHLSLRLEVAANSITKPKLLSCIMTTCCRCCESGYFCGCDLCPHHLCCTPLSCWWDIGFSAHGRQQKSMWCPDLSCLWYFWSRLCLCLETCCNSICPFT